MWRATFLSTSRFAGMSASENFGSVLVVKDEPRVRMFVVGLLQDADLKVCEATHVYACKLVFTQS
jgi:CheY-like chemotaxis protein